MTNIVAVATDDSTGCEALYVNGKLLFESDTVYACDIARECADLVFKFSHILVDLPVDEMYPKSFLDLMKWLKGPSRKTKGSQPENCPRCRKPMFFGDNDDPFLNCVVKCENKECSFPYAELYYKEHAEAEEFRKTELWKDCMMNVVRAYGNFYDEDKTPKLADAMYLKKRTCQ